MTKKAKQRKNRRVFVDHVPSFVGVGKDRPWTVSGIGRAQRFKTKERACAAAVKLARRHGTVKRPVELRANNANGSGFSKQWARTYPRAADPRGTKG